MFCVSSLAKPNTKNRAEKNVFESLATFVRSACSNFFLTDQKLKYNYNLDYSTLFSVCGSPHPATSQSEKSLFVDAGGHDPSTSFTSRKRSSNWAKRPWNIHILQNLKSIIQLTFENSFLLKEGRMSPFSYTWPKSFSFRLFYLRIAAR